MQITVLNTGFGWRVVTPTQQLWREARDEALHDANRLAHVSLWRGCPSVVFLQETPDAPLRRAPVAYGADVPT